LFPDRPNRARTRCVALRYLSDLGFRLLQANANLKADTTDVLLSRKKRMHVDAFKYSIAEIAEDLQVISWPRTLSSDFAAHAEFDPR
jgi:hypothetical protein